MRNAKLLPGILCCVAFCAASPSTNAQTPDPDPDQELIILLAGSSSDSHTLISPDELVISINSGAGAPGGLDVGSPIAARLAITERSTGRTRQWELDHPDTPLARLARYVILTYPPVTDVAAVEVALRQENPNVENVERNYYFQLASPPNDPLLGSPGGDPGETQWGTWALRLPTAWEYTVGHSYIGIIDTGIMTSHPELRAFHRTPEGTLIFDQGPFREHLSFDQRFQDCQVDEIDPGDPFPQPPNTAGHGTHVSGLIAARTNDGQGIAGSSPGASLAVIRALAQGDFNAEMQMQNAGKALTRLVRQGTAAINMSFGAQDSTFSCPSTALSFFCTGLALAEEWDIILAASSGNQRTASINFPARDPRVIAVGGIMPDPQPAPATPSGMIIPTAPTARETPTANAGPTTDPSKRSLRPARPSSPQCTQTIIIM